MKSVKIALGGASSDLFGGGGGGSSECYVARKSFWRKVPTPGNGCSNTGNGGNPCIGSKRVVGGTTSDVASPPPVAHALSSTKN
ncbi:hypothetical protein Tco_0218255 [Tanacetum coccineum]